VDKRLKVEGSGASRMVQLMRKHGYNKDVDIEIGTVTAPLPNIEVTLNDGIALDKNDLIITQTASQSGIVADDEVVIIGNEESQFYVVIDKVAN
jgi:hypothetical protein